MLYWLLYPLKDLDIGLDFLRILGYVSFRTVFATLTSLVLTFVFGKSFLSLLCKINFKENIRKEGPASHKIKQGTPTMGGLLILVTMGVSLILWGNFSNVYVVIIFLSTIFLGLLGFYDDYKKIKKEKSGVKVKQKFLYQIIIASIFSLTIYYFSNNSSNPNTQLFLPFLKNALVDLSFFAIPFWILIITASSNAVNLTDGLDGLAVGLSAIVIATLGIFAALTGVSFLAKYLLIPYIPGAHELCVLLGALLGSCIGFLWFNSYPASIFMGDTGSLSIGGCIGMVAICIKKEILLVIIGGIFVLEAISVILQVFSYKFYGKRIFKMAPIHHHFELLGWHENKIVVRFWIIGILLALIGLSSLKII